MNYYLLLILINLEIVVIIACRCHLVVRIPRCGRGNLSSTLSTDTFFNLNLYPFTLYNI